MKEVILQQLPDEFLIEDGIPLPSAFINRRRKGRYPWDKLEVTQSFLVPGEMDALDRMMNSITSCRDWQQKKTGKQFILHKTSKGVRVWRTA